jgi:hypothetical protein
VMRYCSPTLCHYHRKEHPKRGYEFFIPYAMVELILAPPYLLIV